MQGLVGAHGQHLGAQRVVGLEHGIQQPAEVGDLVGAVVRRHLDDSVGVAVDKRPDGVVVALVAHAADLKVELGQLVVDVGDDLRHEFAADRRRFWGRSRVCSSCSVSTRVAGRRTERRTLGFEQRGEDLLYLGAGHGGTRKERLYQRTVQICVNHW